MYSTTRFVSCPPRAKPVENVEVLIEEEKSNAADGELPALKDKVDDKRTEGSEDFLRKDEEKIEHPQEETKEYRGFGEQEKLETCLPADKRVEVEGVNKEEHVKSTCEFDVEEIEGTKVNSEEHHKLDEINKKAEAELTVNGNHGS